MSEKLNRRAILAGAAALPALAGAAAVPALTVPAIVNAAPLPADTRAATVGRAQQLVDLLSDRYVCAGWHEAFDKERAAKFLAAVQTEDYSEYTEATAFVNAWMRDHGQSLDWLYDGDLLGMITGAAAQSPAAAVLTPAHADAALLELGRRLTVAWAATRALEEKWRLEGGPPFSPEANREFEASYEAASAIVHKIRDATATTIDGLRVKATAISWCQGDEETIFDEAATTDVQIAESIVRDLLAMQQV